MWTRLLHLIKPLTNSGPALLRCESLPISTGSEQLDTKMVKKIIWENSGYQPGWESPYNDLVCVWIVLLFVQQDHQRPQNSSCRWEDKNVDTNFFHPKVVQPRRGDPKSSWAKIKWFQPEICFATFHRIRRAWARRPSPSPWAGRAGGELLELRRDRADTKIGCWGKF